MQEEVDLVKLVIEIDDELIQEGFKPYQRPRIAYFKISEILQPGSSCIFQYDPIYKAVNEIYSQLYRLVDLQMPPMHVGAFMFRDVFFPIRIPIIFGSPLIDLTSFLTDISETQKNWLFSDKKSELVFFDQTIDLMDFVYGLDDIDKTGQLADRAKALEWWYLAKQQLEAAAATVLGSFDKYAVIQNCCISVELLLKGALFAKGVDEDTLKSTKKGYGHNLEKLVNRAYGKLPDLELQTIKLAVNQLPDYVSSRYEAKSFTRLDLGKFVMNAQFISGEILRQFSDRDFRKGLDSEAADAQNSARRTFPEL